jgi:hypothetical protein
MWARREVNSFVSSANIDNSRNIPPLPVPLRGMITNTPWPESASELYRPSDRRLSAKLVIKFADRGSHVVSVTYPYGRILSFLDLSRYFSIK